MAKKVKSKKWFIPIRGSYIPNSREGWLTYIPYSAYLVFILVIGWQNLSSKVDAVIFIVSNWLVATIIMTWIAKSKS